MLGWASINRLVREGWSWSGREANCTYLDISRVSGTDYTDDGRAFATVDWDGDGDLDLWIANRTAPQVRFLRNDIEQRQRFVEFRLTGTNVNRDAIGARVELRAGAKRMLRVLQAGTGYLSQSSPRLHFGTADIPTIDEVLVHWPDGSDERFENVATNQRYAITQGEGVLHVVESPARDIQFTPSEPQPLPPTENANLGLTARVPFPKVTATTFDGQTIELGAPTDKPTLVTLWASWCASCRGELISWIDGQGAITEAGLDIVALSVEEFESGAPDNPARKAASDLGFWFPAGMAGQELIAACQVVQASLVDRNRELPVPVSFLLDTTGRISRIYKGPVPLEDILTDVANIRLYKLKAASAAVPFAGRWNKGPQPVNLMGIAENLARAGLARLAIPYVEAAIGSAGGAFPGIAGNERTLSEGVTRVALKLGEQGEPDLARHWLTTSSSMNSAQPQVWKALGADAPERNEFAEAASFFQRALSLDKQDPETWTALADAQRALGHDQEAEMSSQRAVELTGQAGR